MGSLLSAVSSRRTAVPRQRRGHPDVGRYSFVTADPFDWLYDASKRGERESDPVRPLANPPDRLTAIETIAGLPPFQGGAAGLFGYDLCHHIERLPRPRCDDSRRRTWRSASMIGSSRSTSPAAGMDHLDRPAGDRAGDDDGVALADASTT